MRCLPLLCAVLVVACGQDQSPAAPLPESLVGAWPLRTVNGAKVPTSASNPGVAVGKVADVHRRVRMDSLILSESGIARRLTVVVDSTNNGHSIYSEVKILTDSGTYARDGQSVSIRFNREDAPFAGQLDGTGLSLVIAGYSYRYARP